MNAKKRSRMSNGERRELILKTARELFARDGLDGARTAQLARAAGVSERLLYKHFPSKEALHEAALKSMAGEILGGAEPIFSLEPSTSTLIVLTHYVVHTLLSHSAERDAYIRTSLRSMAGDTRFVRFARKQGLEPFHAKLQKCIEAAVAAGDIPRDGPPARIASYLMEAIVAGVGPWILPDPPIVDFKLDRERLIEEVARFALRGLGLSDRLIRRSYDAKTAARPPL